LPEISDNEITAFLSDLAIEANDGPGMMSYQGEALQHTFHKSSTFQDEFSYNIGDNWKNLVKLGQNFESFTRELPADGERVGGIIAGFKAKYQALNSRIASYKRSHNISQEQANMLDTIYGSYTKSKSSIAYRC
jgi:hypothetical protein